MKEINKYALLNINFEKIEEEFGNTFLLIAPGTFCVFDENFPTNGRHLHNCYELCIVTSGYGVFNHGDEVFPISKGDVFIANPSILHEITNLNHTTSLQLFYFSINIINVPQKVSKHYEEKLIFNFLENHCLIRQSQLQILAYLNFIYEYSLSTPLNDYGIRQAVKNIVLDSLLVLTDDLNKNQEDDNPFSNIVDHAIAYIGSHLSDKIALEQIAFHCKTSKRNLQYHFKIYMKSTIVDYVNTRRMSLAGSYIRMNYTISDIGSKVGIEDPSQFCRVFKKYYGITPKKYQQLYAANGMTYGANYKT